MIALVKWMKDNGFEDETGLRLALFPQTSRGLMCLNNVPQNSVLLSIPMNLVISVDKAQSDVRNGVGGIAPTTHFTGQEILSLWLLMEDMKGKTSFWWPYLQSLPRDYTVPFYTDKHEKQSFPTYLKGPCIEQDSLVSKSYDRLLRVVPPSFSMTEKSFGWAWFTVNTRAVYLRSTRMQEAGDCLALAPFLDMLNHSSKAKIRAGVNLACKRETDAYQILTEDRISKHEEAFISYGPHSNLKLYVEYGFILPNNPHDVVPLSASKLIDSSSKGKLAVTDKLLFLNEIGLTQGLVVSCSGLSWNALACLFVLQECSQKDWMRVYEAELEEEISKDLQSRVLSAVRGELLACMTQLKGACVSVSSKIAFDLLECHARIVDAAMRGLLTA